MIGAVDDGVVAPGALPGYPVGGDLRSNALRFNVLIFYGDNAKGIPGAALTPKTLLEKVLVMGNEGVRGTENGLSGAVVFLQLHHLEGGEIGRQIPEVLRARPAPGVNGLVVVPHHGKGPGAPYEGAKQLVLSAVGILVFVHQQVAHPRLPGRPPARIPP